MKPFFDPALRPIGPPPDDDPDEPYLDEVDIPEDSFEKGQPADANVNAGGTSQDSTTLQLDPQTNTQNAQLQSDSNQNLIDNQTVFNAETILKCRKKKGKTEYFVKWLGYPKSQSTWEQEENILEKRLIENFKRSRT